MLLRSGVNFKTNNITKGGKKMRGDKRALGFLLAMVIMFAAIIPNYSFGAENGTTVSTNNYQENGNEVGQGSQIDTNQKSLSVNEVQEQPVITEDNVPETQIQSTPNANKPTLAADYDVTSPVIEKVEFEENGKTLTTNDTLHFKVWAYDADSGIDSVYAYIYSDLNSGEIVYLNKSSENNLYEGTLSCSDLIGKEFYISRIEVKDNRSNIANAETYNNDGYYIYKFTIDNVDAPLNVSIDSVKINSNDIDQNGVLNIGDTITYTAVINCENFSVNKVTFGIISANNSYVSDYIEGNIGNRVNNQITVTGTYTINENTYPGTWNLNYISLNNTSPNSNILFGRGDFPDSEIILFDVVNDNYDTEPPVIKSVTLDKNGEFLTAGNKITLIVKAEDKDLPQTITAYFYPQVSNVSGLIEYITLNLVDENTYSGELEITEDTYPCMWELHDLTITDLKGNQTSLSDFYPGLYSEYPWYFKVKSENTYVEDVKDVTFNFVGFEKTEYGINKSTIFTQTVKNVGRRSSLTELGVSFPQLDSIEGLTCTGWEFGHNNETITEDKQIIFDTSSVYIYAKYDKAIVNVSYEYLNKDGYKNFKSSYKVVQKGITSDDFVKTLKVTDLPDDADTANFTGFQIGYDEGTIDDYTNIRVIATYSEYSIECSGHYIGENNEYKYFEIKKTYPAGTKIKTVLNDLIVPPSVDGVNFEKWDNSSCDLDLEKEISLDIKYLYLYAYYTGKITLNTHYQYWSNNQDSHWPEINNETKLFLIDESNVSDDDIFASAKDKLSNIEHLSGLQFEEWEKSNIYSHGDRYKNIDVSAKYSNCVVAFHWDMVTTEAGYGVLNTLDECPNGYKVVDRGTQITLPTESKGYKNIVWEMRKKFWGDPIKKCGIGEKVTITEDTYFYTNTYDRKDGQVNNSKPNNNTSGSTSNKPDNQPSTPQENVNSSIEMKLSESKANDLIAQIRISSDGNSISVDMGSATIIPKEVLEELRGKAVDIILNMNGYSWVINGKDIAATSLNDINLEVKLDTDAVPTSLVKSIAGDKPTRQLSLTHNGDFGFRANLVLNLGNEHSGEFGNLYYYDSSSKLVFMDAGQINVDGTVSLSFSHASDYVIIISENMDALSSNSVLGARKSPKTGE